jgi:hypothetical protein
MNKNNIFDELELIARRARTGDYGGAASLANLALARIERALADARPGPKELAPLMYSLETLLLMQKQGDWVAYADVIEYEFSTLLRKVLKQGKPQ